MPNLRHAAARDPALEAALARACGAARQDPPVVYAFQRVGSTMEVAHELAAQGAPEGTLVFAARQEQGRGRLGRTWVSPEGGAYCSLILRTTRSPAEIPQLSLVAGLATAETIRNLAGVSPSIRWPNDVLIDGLKVAGILVEARNNAVVVGIGVNVTTDPADLPANSTSLKKCQTRSKAGTVSDASVVAVTGELYRRCRAWYDDWSRKGFGPIREALRPWISLFGQPVHLTAGTEWFEGTASDLDDSGRLLVRLDSGLMRACEVGEVTLLR
jgi:BirA family biotin operon repressor/biotin-[acetyl-CoA-carboxylase] ligase